jgi:uncharacterized protein with ACT and thioredoxin-like domain
MTSSVSVTSSVLDLSDVVVVVLSMVGVISLLLWNEKETFELLNFVKVRTYFSF